MFDGKNVANFFLLIPMWFVLIWLEQDKMQKYYPRGL